MCLHNIINYTSLIGSCDAKETSRFNLVVHKLYLKNPHVKNEYMLSLVTWKKLCPNNILKRITHTHKIVSK